MRFTQGIDYIFPSIELASEEVILIIQNQTTFENLYGTDLSVIGHDTGRLSNTRERLILIDAINQTILDFRYKDNWYKSTDGTGHSLTNQDPL